MIKMSFTLHTPIVCFMAYRQKDSVTFLLEKLIDLWFRCAEKKNKSFEGTY